MINQEECIILIVNSDTRFKTTMVKFSLCDYSDAYTLVKRKITTTLARVDAEARQPNENNIGVIFKNCAAFINCKSKINNTEIDHDKDIDLVMPMYNLVEYSDNYLKTSGSFQQYYIDEPNRNLTDYASFKSKIKLIENTPADGNTKNVKIIVPLKYF